MALMVLCRITNIVFAIFISFHNMKARTDSQAGEPVVHGPGHRCRGREIGCKGQGRLIDGVYYTDEVMIWFITGRCLKDSI